MRAIPGAVLLAVVTVLVGLVSAGTSTRTADAAPPSNPSTDDLDGAQTTLQQAQAAVDAASAQLSQTQEMLEQRSVEAEAAADTYHVSQAELAAAVTEQQATAAALAQAGAELDAAQADFDELAATTYMMGTAATPTMLLLQSGSPADLIERAGLLESVTNYHAGLVEEYEDAEATHEAADAAAQDAVANQQQAEQAADHALAEATAKLQETQTAMSALQQEQTAQASTLQAAQFALADLQGQRAQYEQYLANQAAQADAAEEQAASSAAASAAQALGAPTGDWVLPCGGTLTSGFGERGGAMHWGIDLAAPMYTPIYAAGDGVVVQAGPATGFGQAVYIQHPSGEITVYGHMEVIEVSAGQQVSAGQEIAQVGSQGQSTGPHLHFEVHVGGMYAERVDPIPWLAERGVSV